MIPSTELKNLISRGTSILDVRAPVEFQEGHIPGSVNIPILNNEHRALVGTAYKQQGREEAIALGHQLVSGEYKEQLLSRWLEFFRTHNDAVLTCFRGGLRSRTTQEWLAQAGTPVRRLDGGYKMARQFFLEQLEEIPNRKNLILVSGPTGSAKSHLLRKVSSLISTLDLEFLARHRGSAFGFEEQPQPSQAQFENDLAAQLIQISENQKSQFILLEDESRMVGQRVVPERLFLRMRESPVVWVDEPLSQRVQNIFEDYILNTPIGRGEEVEALALFKRYEGSLQSIRRKLGGLRTQEVLEVLRQAQAAFIESRDLEPNRIWIEKLLVYYYDPLYLKSLDKRNPKVLHRGRAQEIVEYLSTQASIES